MEMCALRAHCYLIALQLS